MLKFGRILPFLALLAALAPLAACTAAPPGSAAQTSVFQAESGR